MSLLAASLLPVAGAVAIRSAEDGSVAVGILLLAAAFVVRDRRSALRGVAVGGIAAVSVAVSTFLYGGRDVDAAVAAATRVLYLIVPAVVLTPRIDPSALGDQLAQRLRLPARPVVAATAALQRLETLGEQWEQIRRARRARGIGADHGPVDRVREAVAAAFALIVATLRSSAALSLAMDARGFAGAHRRTWAEPAPWHRGDTLVLLAGVAMAALPWVLVVTGR